MNLLLVLLSALLIVAIVIAWRLIAGPKAFKRTTTTSAGVIKRSLKPMLIFIVIASVLAGIGVAISEYVETREYEAKQAETRLKRYELDGQVSNLTVAQAEKYDVCWESGMYSVSWQAGWPTEMVTHYRMEKCLSDSVSKDFLVMQDWYKTDRQCRRGFSGAILESVSCNQAIRDAAKDNRWPIDYFGCGYTNGSRKKGVHLFATTCGGRTDPPEGVVTTIVPIDRAEYEFLYEQSWAKPLLECFARSRLHKGKTTPSGHRIPQKWTQLGEPCEFSYDLLENAAREAGWPMGEYTKRFPVSYYKPNLSEQ